MSHTDTFWKLFWTVVGILALLYLICIIGLVYFYNPTKTADAAAVGIVFDSSRDPFESQRPRDERPAFSGEYFYQDDLPLSFADWSWGVSINWNSSDVAWEGTGSFRVNFLQDWSGMRVDASGIDVSEFDGLSLKIFPNEGIDDLYVELFDVRGNTLGKQSLSWYAPSQRLSPNTWNSISVPFENLFPEGQDKRPISGYAISTVHPGIAYFDSVRLERNVAAQPRWYEPKPVATVAVEEKPPVPIPLPFEIDFTHAAVGQWRTIFGRFELNANGIRIGSIPEKSTGSMSYVRGGQDWTDYSIDTRLYWGQTSAFSLLVRYVDDANFVSCAFSHYNEIVQMYFVKDGSSRLLGTSPGLPIRAVEPWKDARAGASAQGNRVSCYVDGVQALSYEIPEISPTGSVGIETWTRNTYDSPHILQEFSVKPL